MHFSDISVRRHSSLRDFSNRSQSVFWIALQVVYKLRASPAAYSKGRSQAAYLTARSGSAASNKDFTTVIKLPYSPSSGNRFLTIDAV